MTLIIRQLISAISFKVGLVLILSWFYWADSPFILLLIGFGVLLLGIVGIVTTIAKGQEESD